MPKGDLKAPFLGVSDAMPYIKQPGDVTDPSGLLNVVPENDPGGRRQLATRAKITIEYADAFSTGKVAAIGSIARASGISGTQTTNVASGTTGLGASIPSGAFQGQCCVLDADRSVRAVFADTRGNSLPPPSDAGGYGAFNCCWHASDPDIGYFATIAADTAHGDSGGIVIVGVSRISLATNAVTHQNYCVDANTYTASGVNGSYSATPVAGSVYLFSNQIIQFGPYLFVAAFNYVYVFRSDTLVYIKRHAIDWSLEVQGLQVVTVGSKDYLVTATTGNRDESGPIEHDNVGSEAFGEFYRSALQMHELRYTNATTRTAVATGADVFIRRRMPMGLLSTDDGYEDHRGFRPSEYSVARPRGGLIHAFALGSSGSSVYAYIARTNQGFGYDGNDTTQRPDGQGPYITACRAVLTRAFESTAPTYVNPAAPLRYGLDASVGGWERDTASIRRAYTWGANTYLNDIPARDGGGNRDPQAVDNEPSVWAVAADEANGRVFFAGRRSSMTGAGFNVYCFDAQTGGLIWAQDTGGTIQQNGIAIDPTTGHLLVAMIRNKNWTLPDGTPAASQAAEVLELDKNTGQTRRFFDLTDAINYNGFISASTESLGSYGVAVNSRGQVLVALAPFRKDTR